MDWNGVLIAAGYIFGAFMLGYVLGTNRNERAWCALFERLTTIMEKQEATILEYIGDEEGREDDEGEEWKER